jgi:hypothetical protein
MSLFTLPSAQSQPSKRQRRLPSAPHWGGTWKFAVATLRAAIKGAMCNARIRPHFNADRVGSEVIDLVGQLDGFALVVLHVVIGELVRQSKKGDHR